jgi:Uma2 family endonuclease
MNSAPNPIPPLADEITAKIERVVDIQEQDLMVESVVPVQAASDDEAIRIEVSSEEYLERYAEQHYEWVKGVAIKMSPVSLRHDVLCSYLRRLLEAYLALNSIGVIHGDPFLMIIESVDCKREPDLQIILKTNPGTLTPTAMLGAADICIEIVSPGSISTDYIEKLEEYEQGGVGEYWIIDPQRRKTRFHRLQSATTNAYAVVTPDADGSYTTPLLPRFKLHVPTLWQDPLPDFYTVAQTVQAMWQGE